MEDEELLFDQGVEVATSNVTSPLLSPLSTPVTFLTGTLTSALGAVTAVSDLSGSHPTLIDQILRYVKLTLLIFVTSVGVTENSLVFLLFYRKPTLRSFSNRFVLNLSFSHLLQCVLVLPSTVLSFVANNWLLGKAGCLISAVVSTTLNIASVLSLLLIALDRNCAVNSPLHYSMTVTKKRTGALITGIWALAFLIAVPPLFGITHVEYRANWYTCSMKWLPGNPYSITYDSVLFLIGFVVPFLTMSFVYSSMFRAARNNSERARKHSLNSSIAEVTLPEVPIKPSTVCTPKRKFRRWSSGSNHSPFFGDEWKAVRTGLLVVFTFTICWFPHFSIMYLEAYMSIETSLPSYVMFLVMLCSSSACVINPYLYVFRNKASRRHVKKILSCLNPSKKNWLFTKNGQCKTINQNIANPCILTASLVNNTSEKVKALPALYQDMEGQWQMFSTSEERSREELDEIVSNASEDGLDRDHHEVDGFPNRRRYNSNINVHAIYNNAFSRNCLPRNISNNSLSMPSNRLLLFRLRAQLNRDSTSSDTTDNYSMSLDSNNGNEPPDKDPNSNSQTLPSRHGVGKYFFQNESDELGDNRPIVTCLKRVNSFSEEISVFSNQKSNISFLGSTRRRSFIHSHIKNRKSSETTLTSSANSETIDSTTATPTHENDKGTRNTRPKLVRQEDATTPPYLEDPDERLPSS